MYEIKSISEGAIKDIDEKQGRIIGYFSVFGNVDSEKDVVMPGAFAKSLKENIRIKHLWNHDPGFPLSSLKSGKLILKEDSTGLHYDSTVTPTSWGKDVLKLHLDGVVDENSIGFSTVKATSQKGYRQINEVKLWEGSTLTWGSNERAQTIKGFFSEEVLLKKMNNVFKALRNGRYEHEEVFDQLEIYFQQLNQVFIEMKSTQPARSLAVAPDIDEDADVRELKALNLLFAKSKQAAG